VGTKRKHLSGSALERVAEERLKIAGYTTHRVFGSGVRGRGNKDLFGCLDVLAFLGDSVIGVQCGTYKHRALKRKDIDSIPWPTSWVIYVCWCEVNDGDHVLHYDRLDRDGWHLRNMSVSLADSNPP